MNLRAEDLRWQSGGARWARIRMLMLTDDEIEGRRQKRRNTRVVGTPLELIALLETTHHMMSTIVLAGRFAADEALHGSLHELYPELGIVRIEPETN